MSDQVLLPFYLLSHLLITKVSDFGLSIDGSCVLPGSVPLDLDSQNVTILGVIYVTTDLIQDINNIGEVDPYVYSTQNIKFTLALKKDKRVAYSLHQFVKWKTVGTLSNEIVSPPDKVFVYVKFIPANNAIRLILDGSNVVVTGSNLSQPSNTNTALVMGPFASTDTLGIYLGSLKYYDELARDIPQLQRAIQDAKGLALQTQANVKEMSLITIPAMNMRLAKIESALQGGVLKKEKLTYIGKVYDTGIVLGNDLYRYAHDGFFGIHGNGELTSTDPRFEVNSIEEHYINEDNKFYVGNVNCKGVTNQHVLFRLITSHNNNDLNGWKVEAKKYVTPVTSITKYVPINESEAIGNIDGVIFLGKLKYNVM